jgi:hypothetical protein
MAVRAQAQAAGYTCLHGDAEQQRGSVAEPAPWNPRFRLSGGRTRMSVRQSGSVWVVGLRSDYLRINIRVVR